jgi:hypothetical protein
LPTLWVSYSPSQNLAKVHGKQYPVLCLIFFDKLIEVKTKACLGPVPIFGLTATRPSLLDLFGPSSVLKLESPIVAFEGSEEALNALLAVKDHMVVGGRIHLRNLGTTCLFCAITDGPEWAERDLLHFLVANPPKE